MSKSLLYLRLCVCRWCIVYGFSYVAIHDLFFTIGSTSVACSGIYVVMGAFIYSFGGPLWSLSMRRRFCCHHGRWLICGIPYHHSFGKEHRFCENIGVQNVELLQWNCVFIAVSDGQQLHILFGALISTLWLPKAEVVAITPRWVYVSGRSYRAIQIERSESLVNFATLAFADKWSFVQKWWLMMINSGQNRYWVRVQWNDVAFERKYAANEFVDTQGTEEHVDG